MNVLNLGKRLLTLLLCFFIIASFSIACLAIDNADVCSDESVIVSVEAVASPEYSYTFSDGHTAVMHMGFVTKDGYSLGEARLNSRGNTTWVYCMEFFVQAYSANTRVTKTCSSTSDPIWNGLTEEQKQGIKLALLYGYPNSLNGATAADSFAATQALIWEFQTGVRTSTTSSTRNAVTYNYRTSLTSTSPLSLSENYFYNIVSKTSGGTTAYNALVSKIYEHNVKPDFSLSEGEIGLDYNVSSGTYSATLTDANGVLSNYDVSLDTKDGATVTTSGNTLTITCPNQINDTSLVLKRKDVSIEGQGLLILTSAEYGQAMVMGSEQIPVSQTYTVYTKDSGGTIKVLKADAETGKYLSGATIGLYTSSGTLLETGTTNSRGLVVFSDLTVGSSYMIRETAAPSGYGLNKTKIGPITIESAGYTETVTIKDTPSKYYIYVGKQGEVLTGFDTETLDDGTTVNTPVYETQLLDGCEVEVYAGENIYGPDGTLHYTKDTLVDTVVTVSTGTKRTSIKLYPGSYYLREVAAPEGYVISSGDKEVILTNKALEVMFDDLRQRCDLNFKKTMEGADAESLSECYESVSFGVYNASSILDLPADSLLEVIKPDENGDCVMSVELPYGYDYYLKEISTAEDFIIDENSYSFSFTGLTDTDSTKIVELNENNELVNKMDLPDLPEEETIVETMTDDPSPDPVLLGLLVLLEGVGLAWFIIEKKKLTL